VAKPKGDKLKPAHKDWFEKAGLDKDLPAPDKNGPSKDKQK